MKILLVEDDRKIGQFVKKGLEEVSYVTVWARSCAEAEDAMADGGFDIAILDLGLPDGNGLQLLTGWRKKISPPRCSSSARGTRWMTRLPA